MVGILGNRRPEYKDVQTWLDVALDLARRVGDTDALIRTYIGRSSYGGMKADLVMAVKEIESLDRAVKDQDVSEMGQLMMEINKTCLYEHASMHEQCLHAAEKSLQLARTSGIHMFDVYPITHAAMSCMNVGDHDAAAHYIGLLSEHLDEHTALLLKSIIYITKSRHALIRGNHEDALRCIDDALLVSTQDSQSFGMCLSLLGKAQIMLTLGEYGQAHGLLSQAEHYCELLKNEGWFKKPFLGGGT